MKKTLSVIALINEYESLPIAKKAGEATPTEKAHYKANRAKRETLKGKIFDAVPKDLTVIEFLNEVSAIEGWAVSRPTKLAWLRKMSKAWQENHAAYGIAEAKGFNNTLVFSTYDRLMGIAQERDYDKLVALAVDYPWLFVEGINNEVIKNGVLKAEELRKKAEDAAKLRKTQLEQIAQLEKLALELESQAVTFEKFKMKASKEFTAKRDETVTALNELKAACAM